MQRDPHTRLVVLIFLVAAVSTAWQALAFPGPGFGRYWEAPAIARSVASGQGFSNPFGALDTGPTAHLAPLFPAGLAALIGLAGDGARFAYSASLLGVLAHALYCVLFIPLSAIVFQDRRPGIAAAAFSAVVPTIQVLPQWEAIYAAVGAQLFCIATARWIRPGALAGVLCGILLLVSPSMLPVAVAWILYLRPAARQWIGFAVGIALALLPWTIRNYRVIGGWFYVRDNLGIELYVSNAECSDSRDAVNRANGCQARLHPNQSVAEAAAVRDMGELAYNRDRLARARRWIADHPGRFAALTLRRVREFWFPTPEQPPVYEYSRWLITALSAVGIALMIHRRNRAAVFFAGAMLLYPLLYYVVQACTRYRSPALWISVLPAAYAAAGRKLQSGG